MQEHRIKPYQKKLDYSYAFGLFPTIELLKIRPQNVDRVLLSDKANKTPELKTVINLCREKNIKFEFSDRLIDKIAKKENTYAVTVFEKYESRINENSNHLLLDEPSDMGNLGTIIRAMVGFGFYDLALFKPHADIFDPRVVRSSMGAIFQINFQSFYSLNDYKAKFAKHNVYAFALEGETDLENAKFVKPYSLLFGNEGAGLPKSVTQNEKTIKIRQNEKIDSLNLSVSVAIALYKTSLES